MNHTVAIFDVSEINQISEDLAEAVLEADTYASGADFKLNVFKSHGDKYNGEWVYVGIGGVYPVKVGTGFRLILD